MNTESVESLIVEIYHFLDPEPFQPLHLPPHVKEKYG
jgi:hypothetical protein